MHLQSGEYKATGSLKDYIESFWWTISNLPGSQASDPHVCIPNGTLELIIHLEGDAAEVYLDDKWVPLHSELLAGIQSSPVITRMRGRSARFGIRLKPEAFIMLFDMPVASLYRSFEDASALAGYRLNWLFCLIREAPDMQSRVAIAASFLQKKLLAVKDGNEPITKAIRKIWMEEGNISTASLSKSVFIGERQLQRLFKSNIGVSPKLYSRIVRFRSAYEQAQSGKLVAWANVAYSLGYSDQAHFVKDFKNFAGVTPTAVSN